MIKEVLETEETKQLQKAIDSITNIKIIPSKKELKTTGQPTEFLENHQAQQDKADPEPITVEDDELSDDGVLELVDKPEDKKTPDESMPLNGEDKKVEEETKNQEEIGKRDRADSIV